jgi:FkbM family methyltransferase
MAMNSTNAPPPLFLEALNLHKQSLFNQAVEAYSKAASQMENPLPALVNLAVALRQAGRHDQSLAALNAVLKLDPKNPMVLHNLGEGLRAIGHSEEAISAFKFVLREIPNFLPALSGLAKTFEETGKPREAEAVLALLLHQSPSDALTWLRLAKLLRQRGCDGAALAALERACALQPANLACQFQRAQLLLQLGRPQEALARYLPILETAPDTDLVMAGLASALVEMGRMKEALAYLDRALAVHPDSPELRLARARARFFEGDDAGGFEDYTYRTKIPGIPEPRFKDGLWDGRDMSGKTLLLHAERDDSETIQFLRFLPLAAIRFSRVIVYCPPSMKSMVAAMNSVDGVFSEGDPPPAFDAHLPLPDIARLLGMGREIANSPYIRAGRCPPELQLKPPRGTLFKVGLVWADNPPLPRGGGAACSLADMLPLLEFPGIAFYSLQTGPAAQDINRFSAPGLIEDLSPILTDFQAMAHVIAQLDLVIGPDTAAMCLAGALGRPGLLFLSSEPGWRWGQSGSPSAWFPTLRLVRQEKRDDWRGPVHRAVALLTEALSEIVENRTFLVNSAIAGATVKQRYVMPIPAKLAKDAGVAFLTNRETRYGGYEYALRIFLDHHLQPDDVFLDVGAHWGIFSLHAATCPNGPVDVLAIEPLPSNVERLRDWIDFNQLEERIEPIEAAIADRAGYGHLLTESSMGHRLAGPPGENEDAVVVVTLDHLLEERPHLADRRIWAKIDVEGFESEAVTGLNDHIDAGLVAGLIVERGRNFDREPGRSVFLALLDRLKRLGFSLWRFPHEGLGGVLIPYAFNADLCNVIALGPDEKPKPSYPRAKGPVPPITQPKRGRPSPALRIQRTMAHIEARAPDGGFWADFENVKPGAEERAKAALPWLSGCKSVLDLGAGAMAIKEMLPEDVTYWGADLVPWTPETVSVNLETAFPNLQTDAALLLEVIEFLCEPAPCLVGALNATRRLILSYNLLAQDETIEERRQRGFVNDYTLDELESLLRSCGWRIEDELEAAGTRFFLASAV